MLPEMKDLLLIVTVYSVVVFTILFIYGLIIFFKLRRTEREIRIIKRDLDVLLQSSGTNLQARHHKKKEDSDVIENSIVDSQDQFDVTKDVDFIKKALQNSKSHFSPTKNSKHAEMEPKVVSKIELEGNAHSVSDQADLKNEILNMLYQCEKPILYKDFANRLNENNSLSGKHNLIFDLIDQLVKEGIIEVHFAAGKLVIDPKNRE